MKYQIVSAKDISSAQIEAMYQLMTTYYENVEQNQFYADLAKKQTVILLYNETDIIGFTGLEFMQITIDGQTVHGIFSGNTIMAKGIPLTGLLQKAFIKIVDQMMKTHQPLYWFLICKGYKTYRYLSMYFHHYYPAAGVVTPQFEQKLMHAYASQKYGAAYNQQTGIIKNSGYNDYLRKGVAPIDQKALRHPETQYFITANPDHANGDELVCIAKFSDENLKKGFYRMVAQ